MNTAGVAIFLPVALAIVMLGLGMTLTVQDFRRVWEVPKAALVALALQVLLLPAICFGLVLIFDLAPPLAVGMMLLAASPGGTVANLFSHLAGGNVALNVTLTAINSVIALITLPIWVDLSVSFFMADEASNVGLQPMKTLQVFMVVLIPVAVGMWVNQRHPGFAEKTQRPLKAASAAILALVIIGALAGSPEMLLDHFASIGTVALLLSTISLTLGYWTPRLVRIDRPQAIASAFEIGIHNATIALTVAGLLQDPDIALPPAVYGVLMYIPAAAFCYLFTRRKPQIDISHANR
ncbi:bile acid:sodium symporter family protein [Nonomuraea sp. B19D2]|uniref:bile acid:sodium symporter family protein n=1 Tax=Nonomuraea sp. B19D2 TaxID=3159561 RepID=UPI0032DBB8D7